MRFYLKRLCVLCSLVVLFACTACADTPAPSAGDYVNDGSHVVEDVNGEAYTPHTDSYDKQIADGIFKREEPNETDILLKEPTLEDLWDFGGDE